MSIFDGGETILIHRKSLTAVDAYGNPTSSTITISVSNVLVSFESTNEPVDVARDPIDAQLTLYLPNGTVIQNDDRFEVRGEMWLKDGIAKDWRAPFDSFETGVVVHVRKRLG